MKKYCLKCEQEVVPVLETYNSEFEINDKKYKYRAYRGYCPNCNNLIEKAPEQDIVSRDNAFRKTEGIITVKQIENIIEKYDINDIELSRALGWNDNKIENYIMGDIPSKTNSEILFKVLNDDSYIKSILK